MYDLILNYLRLHFDMQGVWKAVNCGGGFYDITYEANVKSAFIQIKNSLLKYQRIGKSTVNDNNGVNFFVLYVCILR